MKENDIDIERAINNAAANVEMEGFHIDEDSKELCRQCLEEKITMEQYIQCILIEYNIKK